MNSQKPVVEDFGTTLCSTLRDIANKLAAPDGYQFMDGHPCHEGRKRDAAILAKAWIREHEQHTQRFRLAVVMPNGYGIDVSWEDRASMETVLRLMVETMDAEGGIDNAIKTVVDVLASKVNA